MNPKRRKTETTMAQMSNAQAALMAATNRWSGIHGPKGLVEDVVMPEADKYLKWLEEREPTQDDPVYDTGPGAGADGR